MIIVLRTWSKMAPAVTSSVPQKLSVKTPTSMATAATAMNTRIGTILATVTIRLIAAASLTPRAIRAAKTQIPTVESSAAITVSPSPSAGQALPMVLMMNTQ